MSKARIVLRRVGLFLVALFLLLVALGFGAAAIVVLDGFGVQLPAVSRLVVGSNLPNFLGIVNVDPNTSRTESATGWTLVAPGTCAQLPTTGRQPLVEGQHAPVTDLIDVQCGSDAGAANGTAACDGYIRRYFPGTVRGGVLVLPDGGTGDLPIDTVLGSALADASGVLGYDAGYQVSLVCCPAGGPACAFGDTLSGTSRLSYLDAAPPPDTGPVDSGPDTSDAADSALPPTITSITPPYGTYEGAITENIVGTHFLTTGHLTTVTTIGIACGGVTPTSDTTGTCISNQGPSTSGGIGDVVVGDGTSANTLTNGYCYLPPINAAFDGGTVTGAWHDANFGTHVATGVNTWTDWSGNGLLLFQPTGANQMWLQPNWLTSGKAALTSDAGAQWISSGLADGGPLSESFTTKITVCQVRSDTSATKVFFQTDFENHPDTVITEGLSLTGTYGITVVAGAAQNYGNTASESRNAIHNYCYTFDNTVGAAISQTAWLDGVSVSYTTGGVPATSGNPFLTGKVQVFNNQGAGVPTGSIAIQTIAQSKWTAPQMANAEACFKQEYAALP